MNSAPDSALSNPKRPALSERPGLVAWLVIIGVVTGIVYLNVRRNATRASGIAVTEMMFKLRAQSAIGLKSLKAQSGPALTAISTERPDLLIRTMESDARTPKDKLYVAIVVGETQSKEQALARLDALSKGLNASGLAEDIAALRVIYRDGPDALDPASQDRLIQRHDYFARVALAHDVAANTEPRKSIEESAARTVLLLGFVGMLLLLLLVVSVGASIITVVLIAKGKIRRAYAPDPSANTAFLEAFALYLVLFFIVFGVVGRLVRFANLNWEWLAWPIIPIAMFWTMRRGTTLNGVRNAFGWHSGGGWLWEAAAGIWGYVAGLPVVALGLFVTVTAIRWTHAVPSHPIIHELQGDGWHVLTLYGVACIFAPVIEETMFRGALFHHLRRRWSWVISAPVVAFIFAVIHPQGWVTVPALGAIAMVLAALREWRGSIVAPMAAHACNNFIVLTIALIVFR